MTRLETANPLSLSARTTPDQKIRQSKLCNTSYYSETVRLQLYTNDKQTNLQQLPTNDQTDNQDLFRCRIQRSSANSKRARSRTSAQFSPAVSMYFYLFSTPAVVRSSNLSLSFSPGIRLHKGRIPGLRKHAGSSSHLDPPPPPARPSLSVRWDKDQTCLQSSTAHTPRSYLSAMKTATDPPPPQLCTHMYVLYR